MRLLTGVPPWNLLMVRGPTVLRLPTDRDLPATVCDHGQIQHGSSSPGGIAIVAAIASMPVTPPYEPIECPPHVTPRRLQVDRGRQAGIGERSRSTFGTRPCWHMFLGAARPVRPWDAPPPSHGPPSGRRGLPRRPTLSPPQTPHTQVPPRRDAHAPPPEIPQRRRASLAGLSPFREAFQGAIRGCQRGEATDRRNGTQSHMEGAFPTIGVGATPLPIWNQIF